MEIAIKNTDTDEYLQDIDTLSFTKDLKEAKKYLTQGQTIKDLSILRKLLLPVIIYRF